MIVFIHKFLKFIICLFISFIKFHEITMKQFGRVFSEWFKLLPSCFIITKPFHFEYNLLFKSSFLFILMTNYIFNIIIFFFFFILTGNNNLFLLASIFLFYLVLICQANNSHLLFLLFNFWLSIYFLYNVSLFWGIALISLIFEFIFSFIPPFQQSLLSTFLILIMPTTTMITFLILLVSWYDLLSIFFIFILMVLWVFAVWIHRFLLRLSIIWR